MNELIYEWTDDQYDDNVGRFKLATLFNNRGQYV